MQRLVRFALVAALATPALAADMKITTTKHTDASMMMGQEIPAQDSTEITWIAKDKMRMESGDTVTIVVSQLPIVTYPAYGPKDNGKNNGEFAVLYRGQIDSADLQRGNRVMVVGMTRPWKIVTVNDLSRNYPIVEAGCLHFWNTQGRDIADFPFYEAGYVTLRQETVCGKN